MSCLLCVIMATPCKILFMYGIFLRIAMNMHNHGYNFDERLNIIECLSDIPWLNDLFVIKYAHVYFLLSMLHGKR